MYLNSKLINILKENKCRCTIILGSGFHNQALGNDSILSSWEKLLKIQDNTIQFTGSYTLDFEKLILKRSQNDNLKSNSEKIAKNIENLITKEICFKLKSAQKKALEFNKDKYPTGFLNPEYVSDIISLNFDTTALELCSEIANFNIDYSQINNFRTSKQEKLDIPFYEVIFPSKKSIRFWFPHGSIIKNNPIILGTRSYSIKLNILERLRKHSKKKEVTEFKEKSINNNTSWYHQMTHSPLLILGAEMSSDEWDIWFAIVNRERNFLKQSRRKSKFQIFHMRECEIQKKIQTTWFEPLCIGLKFNDQWEELEKYFKTKRI